MTERCACGLPLHYSDPSIRAVVDLAIAELGPTVAVSTPTGTWFVPRHYYALHGFDAAAFPQLARVHQWAQERVAQ